MVRHVLNALRAELAIMCANRYQTRLPVHRTQIVRVSAARAVQDKTARLEDVNHFVWSGGYFLGIDETVAFGAFCEKEEPATLTEESLQSIEQ